MAEKSKGAVAAIEHGIDRMIDTVSPEKFGDHKISGRWLCLRDNGVRSVFTLETGGKGIEEITMPDNSSGGRLEVDWKVDEKGSLQITSHGYAEFIHTVSGRSKPTNNALKGEVKVGSIKDTHFWLYALR